MALSAGGNAPYAPPAAVVEVLKRYRDRGLSTPITTEVVERAGVSDTLSRRTVAALKLLEFIDSEGMPTENFDTMSRAPESQYKELLAEHLTAVYGEVFKFAAPATDPYERVRDAFRGFDPKGQQERMVTLFVGLLDFAGLDTSAMSASRRPAPAPSKPKPPTGNGKLKRDSRGKKAEHNDPRNSAAVVISPGDGELPPGLVGLLHQIPRDGAGWTKRRRDTFVSAFTAVLDFSVPILEQDDISQGSPEDDWEADP